MKAKLKDISNVNNEIELDTDDIEIEIDEEFNELMEDLVDTEQHYEKVVSELIDSDGSEFNEEVRKELTEIADDLPEWIEEKTHENEVKELPKLDGQKSTIIKAVENNKEAFNRGVSLIDNTVYEDKSYDLHIVMANQKEQELPAITCENKASIIKEKKKEKVISSFGNEPKIRID